MKRRVLQRIVGTMGLGLIALSGCHNETGPPITPTQPAPLPPPGGFTPHAGKGAMVGGLPGKQPAGGGSASQDAGANPVGSKAH